MLECLGLFIGFCAVAFFWPSCACCDVLVPVNDCDTEICLGLGYGVTLHISGVANYSDPGFGERPANNCATAINGSYVIPSIGLVTALVPGHDGDECEYDGGSGTLTFYGAACSPGGAILRVWIYVVGSTLHVYMIVLKSAVPFACRGITVSGSYSEDLPDTCYPLDTGNQPFTIGGGSHACDFTSGTWRVTIP